MTAPPCQPDPEQPELGSAAASWFELSVKLTDERDKAGWHQLAEQVQEWGLTKERADALLRTLNDISHNYLFETALALPELHPSEDGAAREERVSKGADERDQILRVAELSSKLAAAIRSLRFDTRNMFAIAQGTAAPDSGLIHIAQLPLDLETLASSAAEVARTWRVKQGRPSLNALTALIAKLKLELERVTGLRLTSNNIDGAALTGPLAPFVRCFCTMLDPKITDASIVKALRKPRA